MPTIDKLIVTNAAALTKKYGKAGKAKIDAAVQALIAADAVRGLKTSYVALDDVRRLRGKAVTDPSDPKANKAAIDAIFRSTKPDYLLILGAIDVVPHQNLKNPLYGPDDQDRFAWGDIPYACEAPYSQTIADFRGPTRVVGRLPDIAGGSNAAYLTALLGRAARWKSRPRADYSDYLGISAAVWKKSTAQSLENTFGSSADLQLSPKAGPSWSARLLSRRAHFINCHGDTAAPYYWGQQGSSYPKAHSAKFVEGKISEGTVMTAECCYGAELYDVAEPTSEGQRSICNTYLASGAYGVFGSSTIAYGPSEGNGSADLICQYFLKLVLEGASLGRAALEARQRFAQSGAVLDPADLKTLGQFSLLGDPSIHPVERPKAAIAKTRTFRKVFGIIDGLPAGRELRRDRLVKAGIMIRESVAAARASRARRTVGNVKKVLEQAARELGLRKLSWQTFDVKDPARRILGLMKARKVVPTAIHVVTSQAKTKAPFARAVVLIATVDGGRVTRLRELQGK